MNASADWTKYNSSLRVTILQSYNHWNNYSWSSVRSTITKSVENWYSANYGSDFPSAVSYTAYNNLAALRHPRWSIVSLWTGFDHPCTGSMESVPSDGEIFVFAHLWSRPAGPRHANSCRSSSSVSAPFVGRIRSKLLFAPPTVEAAAEAASVGRRVLYSNEYDETTRNAS